MEKFLFQRPMYRVRQVLELEGLSVSQGTLTGGLRRLPARSFQPVGLQPGRSLQLGEIGELIRPLYAEILGRSRSAEHWHMDETRWMVFADVEGKTGHRWWLWVVVTGDSCVYLLDPSRSASVPKNHLGEDAEGIINADRYSVYKSLGDNIQIAFCWTHMRRDFLKIIAASGALGAWAEAWIKRIGNLFNQNRNRLEVLSDPEAFATEDRALRDAIASMEELSPSCKLYGAGSREQELADDTVHPTQRKVLESLRTHWGGLTVFVDHPEIPMDNSEAERLLRNPVVGRKNYYGAGSVWSGILTAMLFTLFQTLLMNHIDPQKFLLAYFQACAENEGRVPAAIEEFLPWKLSDERKAAWRHLSELYAPSRL